MANQPPLEKLPNNANASAHTHFWVTIDFTKLVIFIRVYMGNFVQINQRISDLYWYFYFLNILLAPFWPPKELMTFFIIGLFYKKKINVIFIFWIQNSFSRFWDVSNKWSKKYTFSCLNTWMLEIRTARCYLLTLYLPEGSAGQDYKIKNTHSKLKSFVVITILLPNYYVR